MDQNLREIKTNQHKRAFIEIYQPIQLHLFFPTTIRWNVLLLIEKSTDTKSIIKKKCNTFIYLIQENSLTICSSTTVFCISQYNIMYNY